MHSIIMILYVSFITVVSQLLLKKGVADLLKDGMPSDKLTFLINAVFSPYVVISLILQMSGYFVWLFVISKFKLSYAFAVSGAFFYLILAVASWVFFNERLTMLQWVGIILITTGIVCMNLRTH